MEPPQETPKAAAMYAIYEQMGISRNLRDLSNKTGTKLAQLGAWSSKYRWQERVQANDTAQREQEKAIQEQVKAAEIKRLAERDIKRARARERMDDERSEIFRSQWAKTLKLINDKAEAGDVKGIMALTTLLNRALDEERLSLGGPTQVTAMTGMDGGPVQVQFVLPQLLNDDGGDAVASSATTDSD